MIKHINFSQDDWIFMALFLALIFALLLTQQRNRPISSHFDLMLGQWQMYISIHVLPTVLYTFPVATTRSISFNNQIILHLLIIFFFLTTFLFDGQGSIYGEIECWSILRTSGFIKDRRKEKERRSTLGIPFNWSKWKWQNLSDVSN